MCTGSSSASGASTPVRPTRTWIFTSRVVAAVGAHLYARAKRGRPWSDPLNDWAKDISYAAGQLPVCDDLFSRSVLIAIPPVLTQEQVQRIIDSYTKVIREVCSSEGQ